MNQGLEIRLMFSAVVILGIFALIAFYMQRKEDKPKLPKSLFLLSALAFLLPLLLTYISFRPYEPISIMLRVIISIFVMSIFGFFFKIFRKMKIFESEFLLFRLLLITFCYMLFYSLLIQGLEFLFIGIIDPESVILTPEFTKVALPVFAGMVLLIYWFRIIFESEIYKFIGRIAKDFIYFSLSLLLLKYIILSANASLIYRTTQSLDKVTISGILLGLIGIFLERVLLWIQHDLKKAGLVASLDSIYERVKQETGFSLKKGQKTLHHFIAQETHLSPSTKQFFKKLNHRFSFSIGKHFIKVSRMVIMIILIFTVLLIYSPITQRTQTILAPAYSIFVKRIKTVDLSPNIKIINSEQVEELDEGLTYIIPIVDIRTVNYSFSAPLNKRFSILNSSDFLVTYTGEYLVLKINKYPVEINVSSNVLFPLEYNQYNASHFKYQGFFREAELFFALYNHGYKNITTVTIFIPSITIQKIYKYIYAEKKENETTLISIYFSWESIPELDEITLITKDITLVNEIDFLIKQIKVITSLKVINTIPLPPFKRVKE
ncbi:MAG: hypothetical protein QXI58_07590 [Candidatus Micrarchaeia archaeon]